MYFAKLHDFLKGFSLPRANLVVRQKGLLIIVLFFVQIVCRVYTCFEGKCNEVKCPTDSLPYKPGVKVSAVNPFTTLAQMDVQCHASNSQCDSFHIIYLSS